MIPQEKGSRLTIGQRHGEVSDFKPPQIIRKELKI